MISDKGDKNSKAKCVWPADDRHTHTHSLSSHLGVSSFSILWRINSRCIEKRKNQNERDALSEKSGNV